MDSMDNFRERFEALEQRTEQLQQHTRTVERRLRWWRGIACGVIVLALLGLPLQSGKAQYEDKDLAQRVADLEYKLEYVSGGPNEIVITGANLRIVNGLGSTHCLDTQGRPIPNCPNGLGNLIVGYNESRQNIVGIGVGRVLCEPDRPFCQDRRTGSHNVVVGEGNNFSQFGGLVVGDLNETSGEYASVSGGLNNEASGRHSSISGGNGGTASGDQSSISGGAGNEASGLQSSISGGAGNEASGFRSSISGGASNEASGFQSSVSGGSDRTAPGTNNWAAGPLFADN